MERLWAGDDRERGRKSNETSGAGRRQTKPERVKDPIKKDGQTHILRNQDTESHSKYKEEKKKISYLRTLEK